MIPPRVRRVLRAASAAARWRSGERRDETLAAVAPTRRVPEWSIGILTGSSPLHLSPAADLRQPVLTRRDVSDTEADFIADPFMIRRNGTWFMFFEVYSRRSWRGEIAYATSDDARHWTYRGRVLIEPFHLSYPLVFEWEDQVYMLPETAASSSVRLYRGDPFPARWSLDTVLVTGEYVDPTMLRWHDRWWLFCSSGRPPHHADDLALFHSADLAGPWLAHPYSPVARGEAVSRPAGRVVTTSAGPIRFAQDCASGYGGRVRAFRILELTPDSYRECMLEGSGPLDVPAAEWNRDGMHHVDAHAAGGGAWLACVDGHRFRAPLKGGSS